MPMSVDDSGYTLTPGGDGADPQTGLMVFSSRRSPSSLGPNVHIGGISSIRGTEGASRDRRASGGKGSCLVSICGKPMVRSKLLVREVKVRPKQSRCAYKPEPPT